MNALLERWPDETRNHAAFKIYRKKIDDGKRRSKKRSGRSSTLNDFLRKGTTETFEKQRLEHFARVHAVYKQTGEEKKEFYTYCLLDLKSLREENPPSFHTFLNSLIYIGKGINDRAGDHGFEALEKPEVDLKFYGRKVRKYARFFENRRPSASSAQIEGPGRNKLSHLNVACWRQLGLKS